MAFAPHTNTDVRHAHAMGNSLPLILGSFKEAEVGNFFEYAVRPNDGVDFAEDCPHIIYTGGQTRYAKVLKTVAWVAVDEAEDGSPIFERWDIRQHRQYPTDWVYRA